MLAKWKADCTVAASGPEALKLISETTSAGRPYALILLDAHMPGMDGFSVAQAIKSIPAYTGVPIMMLSSADLNTDAAYCRHLGIESYLVKPICETELRDAVLKAIAGRTKSSVAPATTGAVVLLPALRKRILLAEDNPVNQKVALRLIEKQGHSVETAGTGAEAVAKSAADDFDLILMDVQMPEMDGLEATRAIRERERITGKHIPIFALTAHAMAGDRDLCLAAGMDGYLSKPISAQELIHSIEAVSSLSAA